MTHPERKHPKAGQNPDELPDVVDALDRVTGRAERREVHVRGLWHRAVHVFIVNGRGEIFLHRRSLSKDSFPGLWTSSCAGHVAAGDDYDSTALRELEEELGWQPEARPARLRQIEACAETGWEFVWVYRAVGDGPFTLNPDEILEGGWFDPAEIERWLAERPAEFAGSFRHLWPMVRGALVG